MNRRSFLARIVGTVVAASLAIRLQQPEQLPVKHRLSATEVWATQNMRRKIFYDYPTDSSPLMGLLDLVDNNVYITNKTTGKSFTWFER